MNSMGTKNEVRFFNRHNIDAHFLAISLWGSTGDVERMTKIVLAHRDGECG